VAHCSAEAVAQVTMMTVEDKPDVTYADIGGCKEQIERMREVVELPMLHPERFVALGIDPPKGVLCYGPPGAPPLPFCRTPCSRGNALIASSSVLLSAIADDGRHILGHVAGVASPVCCAAQGSHCRAGQAPRYCKGAAHYPTDMQ
jgi:hypothetical protein